MKPPFFDEIWKETNEPERIGYLLGFPVMLNRDRRMLAVSLITEFSIDHPYIQGTKLEQHARKILG